MMSALIRGVKTLVSCRGDASNDRFEIEIADWPNVSNSESKEIMKAIRSDGVDPVIISIGSDGYSAALLMQAINRV